MTSSLIIVLGLIGIFFWMRVQSLEKQLKTDAFNRAELYANITYPILVMSLDEFDRTVQERAEAAKLAIAESGNTWKPPVVVCIYNRFNGSDAAGQTWPDFVAASLEKYLFECRAFQAKVRGGKNGEAESAVHLEGQRAFNLGEGVTSDWTKPGATFFTATNFKPR